MSENSTLPEQPFIGHLIELRDRMMRMVLAVFIIFLALFPFGNDIYVFIAKPLMAVMPAGTSMIATQVASPFLTPFKLALVTAVFVAMPYLLHQFWGFIAPGLYNHEKRLAIPLLASSVVLFYLGAVFAYLVVFPLVFAFLTGVAPEGVAVMTDITHYLDFVLTLFFAFGLAFEVPIATIVLVLAGATTPESLTAKRPYVIVGAFVIGMLLTPPDVISQTLLAFPMWVLFEIGLLFSRMLVRDRQRRQADADADGDGDDEPATAPSSKRDMTKAPVAAAATAAAGATDAAQGDDFVPLDEHEMEDEFDRIEAEFEALNESAAESGDASDPSSDNQTEYDDAADINVAEEKPGKWSAEDASNMLDEEDFPARSATEALADAKLQQVAALRATGADSQARGLLYEVLSEGNASQKAVARNILEQIDS
ncbi:MAG: twin-arginine translocase subunit TatC [Chromatiaceae bacterium]|nr:twin-arginine translocase subunit TatC [Gammaproteobacteria bacterium]MCP5317740.1 twin-arginine translocase subunit TatC [Chromatiaceae bacterium]MCP5434788.1 twin-arginine translocase subunit TatC [Chromatiaceae bacterium]HOP17576.1 twin-arginine translocase subunit TatC [Gammaproteobacteria bacterium]HPQ23438.1 twin-arginine translocase subunit TatC [Gammaproteobacteria bacterium]